MEQILITRANATVELINSSATITSIISAEHRKAALGEDVVVMDVETAVDRAFSIGDSIKLFGGNTYKINQIPTAEKISQRKFRYNLVFEGIQYDLLRVLYRNEDVSSFSTSAEFTLTGDIEMFLNVLINNANRTFGAGKWALGEFPTGTETKNLLFSNENCLTVLQRICAEYSYEFTFTETSTQKILNVKRVGTELDFTFEYGRGKGLYNLKRNSVDSKKIINKLFVYGSTKNIPSNYKNYSQRLHFGTVSPFTESVVTDEDSIANFGVCEGSIIFDDVFPTGYNSITAINTSNRLEFADSSMSFDLNAKDGSGNTLYLIPGVTAKVHFNTGNLAGYEFEIEKYTHSTKKFIIKAVKDEKGLSFPSTTEAAFQLAVGDNYSLLDIVMPQSLIDAAESLLQSKGVDYLNENKVPIVKYTVAIDEAYLKNKTSELDIFDVGDSVVIKDSDFNINTRIKIISFSRNVLHPYRYSIVVSDVPEIGALRALAVKANEAERIIRHNGFNDPIKFKQDPNANSQIQSQIDETINRKPSVLIGRDSNDITLGNKENLTLVDVLGGKIKLGENLIYDNSIIDGEGDVIKRLGVDSDFQVDGRIEAVGGISVGQDGILITKELEGTHVFGQINAENELRLIAPVVNVTNVLGVNQLSGIDGDPITAISPMYFQQAIYVQPSSHPNSPITNAQFDIALVAYDFGNIRIYSPVRAASNGSNITLFGEYMLDSVNLVDGDKVLAKDQTDATENYIYIVKASAAWIKVTDLPNSTIKGIQVQVTEGGLVNKGGLFINTNATDVTVGVTEVTFRQSYQNVLNPYAASLAANNQVFQGSNKFEAKLEVRTPLSGTEAANMDYVIAKVGELNTIVTNGYWAKKNTYGIGTSTNNALEFYANNVKEAQLNVGGRLTGLKGLHVNDGVFTPPFATLSTTLANYYGVTVKDNVHLGALGGTSRDLYSLDFVRGSNSGSRAGMRFGSYISSADISNFYYGIEYSTGEKLSIGRYSSSAMDGTSTSLDSTKVTTYDSYGNWAFGKSNASYRVDVNGDVNISGMFRINGSFGADHTFLKSNGTTQEFAPMTVGEIVDIATYYQAKITGTENYLLKKTEDNVGVSQVFDNGTNVIIGSTSAIDSSKFSVHGKIGATTLRVGDNTDGINIGSLAITSTGELGYGATSHAWSVSDTEKLNLNSTRLLLTGDFELEGKFKINGSFGLDHYFVKNNGTSIEWAKLNVGELEDGVDIVKYSTLGDERGIAFYSDVEKTILDAQISVNVDTGIALGIYGNKFIDDDTSNVKQFGLQLNRQDGKLYHYTLDGNQERILTTADQLTDGGTTTWNGGTVSGTIVLTNTSGLNLQYVGYPLFASITTRQITNQTDPYLSLKSQKGIELEATSFLNLKGGEVAINDLIFDTSNAASLVGQYAKFAITQVDFGRYKATLVAA